MSRGPAPAQQGHWDWRASGNFALGGAGSGLVVASAVTGAPGWRYAVGAAMVATGLACVWLEIGRPLRALNVFSHPRRSWMSREAIVAPLLLAAAAAASIGVPGAAVLAAALALAFVACQGFILRAARGIPAWREPWVVPLVVATGLAEGAGLSLALGAPSGPADRLAWLAFLAALAARWGSWREWRGRVRLAPRARGALDAAGRTFAIATIVPFAVAAGFAFAPGAAGGGLASQALQALAGAAALLAGLAFKHALITRGAFDQGFALPHLPVRGVRRPS